MPALPRLDLRRLLLDAQAFGHRFPAIAPALSRAIAEPATERFVEGVAYLAGSVLDRVRDSRHGAHEQLAERVCPWLLRPIPSATIVAFDRPCAIPKWSGRMDVSPFVVQQVRARMGSDGAALEVVFSAEEPVSASLLSIAALYVDGELQEALDLVHALRTCSGMSVSSPDWALPVHVASPRVERCGLEPDDAIAPDPDGPPAPFSAVTEAFVFPHKFRLVRLRDFEAFGGEARTREVRAVFHLQPGVRLPSSVSLHTNCAPVRNLYEASADPMPLAFDAAPARLRVAGGAAYAVRDVAAIRKGELPVPVPDVRRLNATPAARRAPAMFAASWTDGADLAVSFLPTDAAAGERAHGVASTRVLATSGRGGELRTGDLHGDGYRSLVPASRYVPPPTGHAFELRAVRAAAVRRGRLASVDGLREALFLSAPSWVGDEEWTRSMHARVEAIETVDVTVGRRTVRGATALGYAVRVRINETPFQGTGEIDLLGAAIAEGLSRALPSTAFVELQVEGAKTQCQMFHSPEPRA